MLTCINALCIDCIYQKNTWTRYGSINECLVTNVSSLMPNETITSAKVHVVDYSTDYNDVDNIESVTDDRDKIASFYVYKSPDCHYIPRGIAENFKNLKVLIVAWSGLKVVRQSDIKPLTHLRKLNIDHNALEVLEKDLFNFNLNIESINLNVNRIKHVDATIFDLLTNLQEVFFDHNVCIQKIASTPSALGELKSELRVKCRPIVEEASDVIDIQVLKVKITDLQAKIKALDLDLIKIRKSFCHHYNNWEDDQCKDVTTTQKPIHSGDQTEGEIKISS